VSDQRELQKKYGEIFLSLVNRSIKIAPELMEQRIVCTAFALDCKPENIELEEVACCVMASCGPRWLSPRKIHAMARSVDDCIFEKMKVIDTSGLIFSATDQDSAMLKRTAREIFGSQKATKIKLGKLELSIEVSSENESQERKFSAKVPLIRNAPITAEFQILFDEEALRFKIGDFFGFQPITIPDQSVPDWPISLKKLKAISDVFIGASSP
jgi:hypothetical protein